MATESSASDPMPTPAPSNPSIQMDEASRSKLENTTLESQTALSLLLDKIETTKESYNKLERDNHALQEYIGGLTRSMSQTDLRSGRKK